MFRLTRLITCFGLALALLCNATLAAPLHVTVQGHRPDEVASYFPALLRLALEKSVPAYGPFTLNSIEKPFTSLRLATELQNNGMVNVIWDSTNKQRERDLLPIRISLLKNLNDYRAFHIVDGDQARFENITTVKQLGKLRAGGGVNWPSTDVLRENGLPVVSTYAYDSLFSMLAVRRFDYLPRGIYAVQTEHKLNAARGLVVEPTLLLHYRAPFYFFVNRSNRALGERIERGLQIAIKDGSFDKLFYSIEAFREAEAEIISGKRRVLVLVRK